MNSQGYEDRRYEYIQLWRVVHWNDYDDNITTRLFIDARDAWQRYWIKRKLTIYYDG